MASSENHGSIFTKFKNVNLFHADSRPHRAVSNMTAVVGLTPVQSHTVVWIDDEIISTVIFLPSHDSRRGCQLQAKDVCTMH